ncbi:MAG TPA: efflux RND transporter periplasmic adaptor subunit [Victivallales bacterium]|nr:efflux RND transporter periplasmic adaptor subunit [Victivallales bacterium]
MFSLKNKSLFFILIGVSILVVSCRKDNRNIEKNVSVQFSIPEQKLFEKIVRVHGNIEAREYAELSSRVEGVVDLRPVDEGGSFKKGDVLFQIDKIALENELLSATEDLKVVESNVFKSEIGVEIAKLQMEKAEIDYKRAVKLRQEKVISEDEYERQELYWKKALADLKQSEASLAHSKALRDKAKSNLEIAKKNLSDSIVRADFDGIVSAEFKEVGEYADKAKPVLHVENPASLEAIAFVGSDYYHLIEKDSTSARISIGSKTVQATVSYCAPNIDPVKRTFKIKIKIPPENGIVSGMLCDIGLIIEKKNAVGVPASSVLEREGGRKILFAWKDPGIAEEMEVVTGIEQDGWIEIQSPDLTDKKIIVEGQWLLNNGDKIKAASPTTATLKK